MWGKASKTSEPTGRSNQGRVATEKLLQTARNRKEKGGRKGKGRDLGYTLAASSCEGANCVEYAPSRPLMRSLLSQFQTPTTPRRAVGFFGSGCSLGRPSRTDHPAYFGLANVYFSQPFQPSTGAKVNTSLIIVNAAYWCKLRPKQLQTQRSQVVEQPVLIECGNRIPDFPTTLCTATTTWTRGTRSRLEPKMHLDFDERIPHVG